MSGSWSRSPGRRRRTRAGWPGRTARLSLRPARDRRRLENQIDAAVAAARAHHPIVEPRQRHVAPARPDERLHIQLGAIPTLRRRPRVIHLAVDAARVHPPAGRQGVFQGLDRHENIKRTTAASVKPAKVTGDPRRLFALLSRAAGLRRRVAATTLLCAPLALPRDPRPLPCPAGGADATPGSARRRVCRAVKSRHPPIPRIAQ